MEVDKIELKELLKFVKSELDNEEEYTKESWAAAKKVAENAVEVRNNDNVTQAEVDEAITNLKTAIYNLVTIEEAAKTDFLTALVDKAEEIDVADIEINGENIYIKFNSSVDVAEVRAGAAELVQALGLNVKEGYLIIGDENFDLKDTNIVSKVANRLLMGMSPEEFIEKKVTVTGAYTAEIITDVKFNLDGNFVIRVTE